MNLKKLAVASAFVVAAGIAVAPAAGADPIGQGGGACTDPQCPPPVRVFMSPNDVTKSIQDRDGCAWLLQNLYIRC
ncbi:MAG TPA: hypothetical protein VME67_28165 [Mycobacterium sp.]|nr:hypothetical protein [Mycobacterium sp.]HTX98368.1 hypothetical protein [Mycobacterium sp.]